MASAATNAIRELVKSRIRVLAENLESASALTHAGTVGNLREAYLREFMAQLIPRRFAITSGFITDPVGNLSPQLDFIAYDRDSLPPLFFPTDIAVVPVDSAVLAAEIKSTLNTASYEQVQRQRRVINDMYHTMKLRNGARFILPHVILAYESSVTSKVVESWLTEAKDLVSVCVIKDFSLDRIEGVSFHHMSPSPQDEHLHVLTFIFRLANLLQQVVTMRGGTAPRLEEYLLRGY